MHYNLNENQLARTVLIQLEYHLFQTSAALNQPYLILTRKREVRDRWQQHSKKIANNCFWLTNEGVSFDTCTLRQKSSHKAVTLKQQYRYTFNGNE